MSDHLTQAEHEALWNAEYREWTCMELPDDIEERIAAIRAAVVEEVAAQARVRAFNPPAVTVAKGRRGWKWWRR